MHKAAVLWHCEISNLAHGLLIGSSIKHLLSIYFVSDAKCYG